MDNERTELIVFTSAIFWFLLWLGLRDRDLGDGEADLYGIGWLVVALACLIFKISPWWLIGVTVLGDFLLINKILGWVDVQPPNLWWW